MKKILVMTQKGIYCPEGDFYIDPSSKVERAIVTHAHSDHTRKGSTEYFCAKSGEDLLRHRIGAKPKINAISYRKQIEFGTTKVSFHPAGHILGSSQIRVQSGNEVWVVSGDYKRQHDSSCEPFEVVPCDVFITEATFANPYYVWQDSKEVMKNMIEWIEKNKKNNCSSILFSYSLGKSQRILSELTEIKETIYLHPTVVPYVDYYRKQNIVFPKTEEASLENNNIKEGSIVIAPLQARRSEWMQLFDKYSAAYISGWALNQSHVHNFDKGFALSDHVDWPALLKTIEETGAKKVYVMHGNGSKLISHLSKNNITAADFSNPIIQKVQYTLFPFLHK